MLRRVGLMMTVLALATTSCAVADDSGVAATTAVTLAGRFEQCVADPPLDFEPSSRLVVDAVGEPGGEVGLSWDTNDPDLRVAVDIPVTCWSGTEWIIVWMVERAYSAPVVSIAGPEGAFPIEDEGLFPADGVIPIPREAPDGTYVAGELADRAVFEVRTE